MKKTLSIILIFIMCFYMSGTAFAEVEQPTQPDKPVAESYKDNENIEKYNKEVDKYNKEVDTYNSKVDEDYDSKVQEVNKKNSEEQQKQKDSEKAHNDAISKNEEIKKANEDIDKKYEEDVVKYNQEKEKYDKDYEQYEKDKKVEEQILAATDSEGNQRYHSVEEYNETVKTYNEKVEKRNKQIDQVNAAYGITDEEVNNASTRNTSAQEIGISNTYQIIEGETKSGRKIPVHIEHTFYGTTISYTEDFEIDANDIIILKGISSVGDHLNDQDCYFFYNTDDNHTLGMWSNSWSQLYTNPTASVNQGWQNGDIHTVTYKDSTNEYQWNFEDITIKYNYMWLTLYKKSTPYAYANVPLKPTAPEEVVKEDYIAYIEVPELYTGKTYEYPIKLSYLSYLDHMNLFDVPPNPSNKNTISKVPVVASTNNIDNNGSGSINRGLNNSITVSANSVIEETITEDKTPLFGGYDNDDSWALINLLTVIVNAIIVLVLLIMAAYNRRKESDDIDVDNKLILRFISVLVAVVSAFIFLLTEDMSLPMVYTDEWTYLMLVIMFVNIIIMALSKHKEDEDSNYEQYSGELV